MSEEAERDCGFRLFRLQVHREDERFADLIGDRVEDQPVESILDRFQPERVLPRVEFVVVDRHLHRRFGNAYLRRGVHIVEAPFRAAVGDEVGAGIDLAVVLFDGAGDSADLQKREIPEGDPAGNRKKTILKNVILFHKRNRV